MYLLFKKKFIYNCYYVYYFYLYVYNKNIKFVLDCFHSILSIFFRLGEDYYKVFTECVSILASEDMYKNPNSLESKKIQAFNSAKACAEMAKNMSTKMKKCNDINLMGKINESLRCIWDLMSEYRNTVSYTRMGSLIRQQLKYNPLLLHSRQTDCNALLVDIEIFCRNVLRFYKQSTNISSLNKGIRLTYTTCRYLQDLLLANPCFHEMPPPPSCPPQKPKKMRRSTWNY